VVCPVSPDNPRNTEGSIVELRDGRLLLAYTRFYGGGEDEARADISARLSSDGGKTWSAPFVLQPNDGQQNVMSVSLLRLDNGELMLGYLRKNSDADCRMVVRRSRDEGVTWGPEVSATEPPRYYVVNNDRIVQLRSGRLLVPAADHGDIARGGPAIAVCYLSDDRGATWRRGEGQVELPGVGCQEPGVVELRDGRVLMIIRNSLGAIRQALSTDGGSTWGAPNSTGLTSPVAPSTIKRIPTTGDLLMIWNNDKDRRVPLTTAVSRDDRLRASAASGEDAKPDDGKTWEHVRDLEPTGSSYAYTSVAFVGACGEAGEMAVLSYWTAIRGGLALKIRRVPVAWFYGS
jgi:sialidase-1